MTKKYKIEGLDCANCARELEEELNKIEGVSSATVDFIGGKVILDCDDSATERALYCCNHFEDAKIVGEVGGEVAKTEDTGGKKIKIANLCCANCARELEEELNKLEGVSATVDFMNMTVILKADSTAAYEKAVYCITHFEDVKIVDVAEKKKSVFKENLTDIIAVIISAVFFIPAVVLDFMHLGGAVVYVTYALYGVAFLAAGYTVLWNTARNIIKGKVFDENFLMTLAAVGAIVLGVTTGDGLFEGVAVMLLYRVGELLQSVAVGSSRRSITRLMDLKSDTATLIRGEERVVVSPESLVVGDKILIRAGEKVPVDCRICEGETSLDMKSLNGEAVPREVKTGDELLSGAINITGAIECEVLREYKNSAVAKILELVENSTAKKAKPEKFITKFAKYYTPIVVIAALLVAGLVPTIICAVNGAFVWPTYGDWIYKALSFLVISCPCALVISVPLSYFGGIGRCAKFGILVKGSTCIDQLAKAYVAAFKDVETPYTAKDAKEVAGRGVICMADGKTLLCGNAKLLEDSGVKFTPAESVSTLVYVALDGAYVGVIEIDDRVKDGAKQALEELKKSGIGGVYMLTGDNKPRAEAVAEELGLDGVYAQLLPDEKLERAKALKEKGGLIYAGDGINDAPVMTVADCAVSMGQVGSDAAIEASDVVLVSDNLSLLPKARRVAKGTRRIVIQNIVGSLIVKFAIMALSIAIPTFPLIASIFADVGVMLIAVCNALRTALIK